MHNDNRINIGTVRLLAAEDDAGDVHDDDEARVAALLQELDDFKKRSKEKLDWVKSASPELVSLGEGIDTNTNTFVDMYADERKSKTEEYMDQSLVSLKGLLCKRLKRKSIKGNKPALAKQLANLDLLDLYGESSLVEEDGDVLIVNDLELSRSSVSKDTEEPMHLAEFAGLTDLSKSVGTALGLAQFYDATPTQKAVIPLIYEGKSVIVHAETGSGKVRILFNVLCFLVNVVMYITYNMRTYFFNKIISQKRRSPI